MAHGKTKAIGKIKTGDKVEAADPATGKHKGDRTVQHVWINHDYDLIDLRIRLADGTTATLHTTSKHPFWDDTRHVWVPAGKLTPGHALNTATNRHVRIAAVTSRPGDRDMYNLAVSQLHTFYVLADDEPVLVHNASRRCILPGMPSGFTPQDPGLVADKIAAHATGRSIPGVADDDIAEFIEDTMRNAPGTRLRDTSNGTPRWGWWVGPSQGGTMIIREGNKGTFMQPGRGYAYYQEQVQE
ncbi:polymorphic toxin-type HINT domain-containing protein [Streptomyces sp. NPDC093060]|uniref:polymorphic toxin-type HINT domain-containing protein n=1 Tax=Streptomyces sp. NPDC093060 TaxID=3366019 RepID=UPI00382D38B1